MNRRSFFGASAGAVAAVPALTAASLPIAPQLQTLSLAVDAAPLKAVLGEMVQGVSVMGRARPFAWGGERSQDRYVYRTGYPAIDCLRSVSGVHRERMERRAAEASG